MTIEQEGNPPILSFEEIDATCMQALIKLDQLNYPPEVKADAMETIILGTLKEMLRTLDSIHPKRAKVLVS